MGWTWPCRPLPGRGLMYLLYPKNPTWRWLKAIPTPRSENDHNFLMTVRPLSWACGHATEMLLILKKIFSTWIFSDIFRYDSPKKCPPILYTVSLWLKPVSDTEARLDRYLCEWLVLAWPARARVNKIQRHRRMIHQWIPVSVREIRRGIKKGMQKNLMPLKGRICWHWQTRVCALSTESERRLYNIGLQTHRSYQQFYFFLTSLFLLRRYSKQNLNPF